jgi:uncharacterized coiled-coil protein SlyX
LPGEVFTAVQTSDALRQTEIQALRQLSDSIAVLNRTVDNLSTDVRSVRETVIKLEAQELKASINSIRIEFEKILREGRAGHDKRATEHEKRMEALETRANAGEVAMARLRGVLLPLAVLGTSLMSGGLAFIAALVLRH